MNNNRVYGNSARHRVEMNKLRRRGTNLQGNLIDDPSVDFAEMARSYGAYGIGPIEEPQEIGPALEEAIKIVKEKRTLALVDMITKLP
jgi:acetolactate synthase-1/2/3 large subunit